MPITRDDAAGWILRCQPGIWAIGKVREECADPVPFALAATYRRNLIHAGDPVFLWVGGSGPEAGVAAVGTVTAPATSRIEPAFWLDPERGQSERPYISVELHFLDVPVPRAAIANVRELRALELLRVPRALNPSVVTARELPALRRLLRPPT